ncbi:MAG: hypothetical protein AAFZ01_07345 [Pseudomonadota bacterium]
MIRAKTLASVAAASLFGAAITAFAMSSEHAAFDPVTLANPSLTAQGSPAASRTDDALSRLPALAQPPAPTPSEVPEFVPGQIKTVLSEKLLPVDAPKIVAHQAAQPARVPVVRATTPTSDEVTVTPPTQTHTVAGVPLPVRATPARVRQPSYALADGDLTLSREIPAAASTQWSGDNAELRNRVRRRASVRPKRATQRARRARKPVRQTRYRNPFGHSLR